MRRAIGCRHLARSRGFPNPLFGDHGSKRSLVDVDAAAPCGPSSGRIAIGKDFTTRATKLEWPSRQPCRSITFPERSMPSRLFAPIAIGEVELPNRLVVAPMCQYSA